MVQFYPLRRLNMVWKMLISLIQVLDCKPDLDTGNEFNVRSLCIYGRILLFEDVVDGQLYVSQQSSYLSITYWCTVRTRFYIINISAIKNYLN